MGRIIIEDEDDDYLTSIGKILIERNIDFVHSMADPQMRVLAQLLRVDLAASLNERIQGASNRHDVYRLTVYAPLDALRGVCDLNGHADAEVMSRHECLTAIHADKGI